MKRKKFNFDVMTAEVSGGIKLSATDNEYSVNCIDLISDYYSSESADDENDPRYTFDEDDGDEEDEGDGEQKARGALLISLLSLGVTLLGLLMLII